VQSKPLHIVFEVLNFLSSPALSSLYDLSSDEKLLLIFLSKHKGVKGIYPSAHTLARELVRHHTCIRKSLKKLVKKNLIKITLNPGKSSHYTIILPNIDLSTGVSTHAYSSVDTPYAPMRTLGTHPCIPTLRTGAYQSERENNKVNNTERARTKRAPLSLSWSPNDKNMQSAREVASKVGKTTDQLIIKFKNLQISKEATSTDWDRNFENYLIDERVPVMLGTNQPSQDNRPKLKDWTQERIEREQREAASAPNARKAQEAQPEESVPAVEHIPFLELKRRYLLKQQGELSHAEEDSTIDTGNHHSRGSGSN
jgi:predicted transcriptional regulator